MASKKEKAEALENTMIEYHLAPNYVVDRSTERELRDNNQLGDARVALVVARLVHHEGNEIYLQTNGGPRLIDAFGNGVNERYGCTLEEAAEALRCTPDELQSEIEAAL